MQSARFALLTKRKGAKNALLRLIRSANDVIIILVIGMKLKEIRTSKNLTQSEAANILSVSVRSYKDYENVIEKFKTPKYHYLCETLAKYNTLDEEHGLLKLEVIKEQVKKIFDKYNVNFCYLFGSYAKGYANPKSDVDLLIDAEITGLDFYGLVEELREELHKKIDLLKINQLEKNLELTREILKDGIKIYG